MPQHKYGVFNYQRKSVANFLCKGSVSQSVIEWPRHSVHDFHIVLGGTTYKCGDSPSGRRSHGDVREDEAISLAPKPDMRAGNSLICVRVKINEN